MSEVHLGNARDPEQLRRMEELQKKGDCHFCGDIGQKHTAPVIKTTENWFVVANDFPYKGSIHHYLVVSRAHITKISEVRTDARIELFEVAHWLETKLDVNGFSFFVRSGNMSLTGATLDHLHFHFLVGAEKPKNAKFPDDNLLVTLGYKEK
ncbi:MAG: HIT domain-containing protein [Patescibacteria group bacterium]